MWCKVLRAVTCGLGSSASSGRHSAGRQASSSSSLSAGARLVGGEFYAAVFLSGQVAGGVGPGVFPGLGLGLVQEQVLDGRPERGMRDQLRPPLGTPGEHRPGAAASQFQRPVLRVPGHGLPALFGFRVEQVRRQRGEGRLEDGVEQGLRHRRGRRGSFLAGVPVGVPVPHDPLHLVVGEAWQERDRRLNLLGAPGQGGDQPGPQATVAQDGRHVVGGHRALGRQGGEQLLVAVDQEPAPQPLGRRPRQQRGKRCLEGFLPPLVTPGIEPGQALRRGAQGLDHRLEGLFREVLAHREVPPQRIRTGIDHPRIPSHA
ncbi:hypothetical protein ACIO8F_38020 [Streptomyces sp. NPDC087228]|uniref:hypothetical protein n=1 Tax=Streptomyces sp. NPDC087228 TaxID=3365772 RepID=UPI0037F780AE